MSKLVASQPLAISLGDPSGVGPEIVIKAWAMREEQKVPPFFITGGKRILAQAAKNMGIQCPIQRIETTKSANEIFQRALPVFGQLDGVYSPGQPSDDGARLAISSLELATKLTIDGNARAVITAPIAKGRAEKIGFSYPGQTEFLAEACGIPENAAVMMLAGPSLRTVPVTVHHPLTEVSNLLTEKLIFDKALIVVSALKKDFGISDPSIAITGLNPHAGEDGKFGDEEKNLIEPAIKRLAALGHRVSGPHPADSLFSPQNLNKFDAAICMYHDQALIPVKALDFDQSVNVTLGLPIIRTSPDHGTAFNIAGKTLARADAMIAAINMASAIAFKRFLND